MKKFSIEPSDVKKVMGWIKDGGVALWESQEIGTSRPQLITGLNSPKPHWAYSQIATLSIGDIEVWTKEKSECLEPIIGGFKNKQFGIELYRSTKERIDKICKEYGVEYHQEYIEYGKVEITFWKVTKIALFDYIACGKNNEDSQA